MRIILASGSKQRQDILKMIGLKYEVIKSLVDEESNEKNPDKYVCELSLNKAKSVANQISDKAIIIAADTIIYCNNKKYEKPNDKIEAFNNIKEISGKENYAYTGITIFDLYQNKIINEPIKTKIKFRKVNDDEIKWYVENEEKILKCCGYVPLGKASIFIERIEGDYNNLFGLSPYVLVSKLKDLGYNINDFELDK